MERDMRTEDLEELLAKFYDGKTDEQEEERLFAAFQHEQELPAGSPKRVCSTHGSR